MIPGRDRGSGGLLPWRHQLAWRIVRHQYRHPILGDVPCNNSLFKLIYGDARKFWNYAKVRRAYRREDLTVNALPSELRVDPSSACNLRCPLCPTGTGEVDREQRVMSVKMFSDVVRTFGAQAFCFRMWAWGEPLLNRHIWQLVRHADECNIGTEISTNLSVELSDEHIDRLLESKLTWLTVSIDAASAETYSRYRINGSFELVLDNLRRLIARKERIGARSPFVEWQFVPLRHNEREMSAAVDLARSIGVDGVRFKPARADKTRQLSFNGQEPPRELLDWMPTATKLRHSLRAGGRGYIDGPCPMLWQSATIHPDHGIAFCCETYGKAHDVGRFGANFRELWNGKSYRDARRIALGIDLTESDASVPCYHCRVFSKPHLRSASASATTETSC